MPPTEQLGFTLGRENKSYIEKSNYGPVLFGNKVPVLCVLLMTYTCFIYIHCQLKICMSLQPADYSDFLN